MKTFRTKSGTELPLANIKGKDYLLVPHRVQWFREEHPDWSIETSRFESTDDYVVFRAEIKTSDGRIVATAHKREDYEHFADALEKSETSAIGRALALCGYGTQFAHELEESDRIVDSPLERRQTGHNGRPVPSQANPSSQERQEGPDASLPQERKVVRPVWTTDNKKQYSIERWGVASAKDLTPEQLEALSKVSTHSTFDAAMREVLAAKGVK